jgi:hypothetical protein
MNRIALDAFLSSGLLFLSLMEIGCLLGDDELSHLSIAVKLSARLFHQMVNFLQLRQITRGRIGSLRLMQASTTLSAEFQHVTARVSNLVFWLVTRRCEDFAGQAYLIQGFTKVPHVKMTFYRVAERRSSWFAVLRGGRLGN